MCKSGTVGNMGNVGNVGTKNFQKNEKKPGAGPGEENEAKNVGAVLAKKKELG